MRKLSVNISNHFCPHPMPLFLYGTYNYDGALGRLEIKGLLDLYDNLLKLKKTFTLTLKI